MKSSAMLVSAAVVCVLVASTDGSAEIKVTPKGHIGSISAPEQQDIFNQLFFIFLQQGQPLPVAAAKAQSIAQGTITVVQKGATNLTVTLSEDSAGELPPCIAVAFPDNTVLATDLEVKKGDGQYDSQPMFFFHFGWGGVAIFDGASSVNEPMKLHLEIVYQ